MRKGASLSLARHTQTLVDSRNAQAIKRSTHKYLKDLHLFVSILFRFPLPLAFQSALYPSVVIQGRGLTFFWCISFSLVLLFSGPELHSPPPLPQRVKDSSSIQQILNPLKAISFPSQFYSTPLHLLLLYPSPPSPLLLQDAFQSTIPSKSIQYPQ